MRVLLNIRWPVGGIRTYLRYVYRRFPVDRFSFVLVSPDPEGIEYVLADLGRRVEQAVVCKPTSLDYFHKMNRALKSNEIDLVHSHGLSSGLLAAVPMRFSVIPHVVTLHDVFSNRLFDGAKGRIRHFFINLGLQLPDAIHLLGNDPKKNFEEFFPMVVEKSERIEIIKSGIEIERFYNRAKTIDMSDFRSEQNIPDITPALGFFGRFMGQKGFGILVDAIEIISNQVENISVPIVTAFGGGGFLDREKRMLHERGLMKFFRFSPFLPNIADVLAQLDGVVMPSRWETAPILPMEVLVHGTPLIVSDCIGLREITRKTPAFVFKASDPSDLAMTLRKWSIDPRKDEFTAFASDAALRFDVHHTAKKLQDLYFQLLTQSRINDHK